MLIALLVALAVWFGLRSVHQLLIISREKREINERIAKWTLGNRPVLSWSDQLVEKFDQTDLAKKLEPILIRASISLRPTEFIMIIFMVGVFLAIGIYFLLGAGLFISILISAVVTPVGVKVFLNSRKHIYSFQIDSQLSDACRLLSSAARAGLSVPQGLELVVKEMPKPISHELGIVYREVKLGKSLEQSLQDMLERVSSKDLQVFVNALIIQRRAGGDLASVLSEMARTMEERKIITQTIQASVSQAKYSAYALPLVSILTVIMLSKMIDGFFDLITSFAGLIIVTIFLLLQILGVYLVRKISDIKV